MLSAIFFEQRFVKLHIVALFILCCVRAFAVSDNERLKAIINTAKVLEYSQTDFPYTIPYLDIFTIQPDNDNYATISFVYYDSIDDCHIRITSFAQYNEEGYDVAAEAKALANANDSIEIHDNYFILKGDINSEGEYIEKYVLYGNYWITYSIYYTKKHKNLMGRLINILNNWSPVIPTQSHTNEDINKLIMNGIYAEQNDDLKNAIMYFEQSKKVMEELNQTNKDSYILVLYKLASLYNSLGDYTSVEKYLGIGGKVLEVIKEDNPKFVVFSHNLACCYYTIGNYSKAIEINMKSLELCKKTKGEHHPDYLRVLRNTSECYFQNGDYSNAIELYTSELNLIRKFNGEFNSDYATALDNLANCYFNLGDYPHAFEHELKALEIRNSVLGQNHPECATSLNNLANYCNNLLDYTKAIEYASKALGIYKSIHKENHQDYAISLNNLAMGYYGVGQYDKAIELGNKALEIEGVISGEKSNSYIIYLNNLALYNLFKGNYSRAIELCFKGLDECEPTKWGISSVYSALLDKLALIYYFLGDFYNAKQCGMNVLEVLKNENGDKHPLYLTALRFVASCDINLGNYKDALINVTKSISLCKSNILHFFSSLTSHQRFSYWGGVSNIFTDLYPSVFYQTHSNNIADLYNQSALFAKGILLTTDIEMRKLILESENPSLITKYDNFTSNISIYNKLLETPIDKRFLDTDSLYNVIQRQELELIQDSKVYGDYSHNMDINWKDIQRRLGDNDISIEFLDFPICNSNSTMYVALTLKKNYDSPHMVKLFEDKQLKAISKESYYSRPDIYNLVWKPLEEEIRDVRNIYFAPSGELHRIGIEYLPINKMDNIGDKYTLFRLSSSRQLAVVQDETKGENTILYGGINYDEKSNAILSDSVFSKRKTIKSANRHINVDSLTLRGSFDYLEGTKREVDMIAEDMKQHRVHYIYFSGTEGTEESFKSLDSSKPQIIHIATHGFYYTEGEADRMKFVRPITEEGILGRHFEEDKPMTRSGLLFSGCNRTLRHEYMPNGEEDGILTAQEISTLDLRGLDLVVLSACQTGIGDVISGEGVFGLQRGFKKAGANTILMSLDKVDDEATRILMVEFYRNLMDGKTKHQSLKDAQKYLREYDNGKYSDPQYWASFIMLDGLN